MLLHRQRQILMKEPGVWEKDFLKVADYEIPPIQAVGSDEEF